MKLSVDVETGELKALQNPKVSVAEVYVLFDQDSFKKSYGIVIDNLGANPYAFTHLENGLEGIWEGYDPQWGPSGCSADEWVISDLYTGRPLYLGKSGSDAVPGRFLRGWEKPEEAVARWGESSRFRTIKRIECPDLKGYIERVEGPIYAEEYFSKNGFNRREYDYWGIDPESLTTIPCFYQGVYQEVQANVYVINGRAFAIPFPECSSYLNQPFHVVDLVTTWATEYQSFSEVSTTGFLDAVQLSMQDPLIEGLTPPWVPQSYLHYLDELGKDYWMLATKGIPALIAQ